MSTEAEAIQNIVAGYGDPTELERGKLYLISGGDGQQNVIDTDQYADNPRQLAGRRTVRDAASFTRYVKKHGTSDRTEVYADRDRSTVTAVLDAHRAPDSVERAGRERHTVTLELRHTPAWEAWANGQGLKTQEQFAEFVEEHALEFESPDAATMLELAQSFQATRGVEFRQGVRLSSGTIQVNYAESDNATAGKQGQLEVPEKFTLLLQPYQGGDPYRVTALLRWRLVNGGLQIGYKLLRLDVVLEDAFKGVLEDVTEALEEQQIPLFFGKSA